jgi:phenylacetate-CoA ligase
MYTRICSSALFPLHEWAKGHSSVNLHRELERTQWRTPVELQKAQLDKLRRFLSHAGAHVPYYRRLFQAAAFDPAGVQSVENLRSLPFLDKAAIRVNLVDLKADDAGKLVKYNTGGSSGEPLVFYMGMDRVSHDVAAKWRATRWWGVDIGDPEIVLWGSPVELGKQDRIKALRDRLFRSHLLPAFDMSPTQMDRYLDRIGRLRPRMLFGYASALALLARHAEQRGRPMNGHGVKVAFATGETLYPDQREVIERVFGAPVANGYGSRDAGFIAHQCPAGSLHLSAEHIVVELVDERGDLVPAGEPGEIVVTHMATGDFPFIRYRTGDVATLVTRQCPCGRGLPAFESVQGRTTDFIRTPEGRAMHALALIYEVRDKPGVRAFKFVQAEDFSLQLLVCADAAFTDQVEAAVRSGLGARLGQGVGLTVKRVDEIRPEASGKYRYVVSRAPAQAVANSRAR